MAFDLYNTETDNSVEYETEALAKDAANLWFGYTEPVTWEPGEADGIQYGYYTSAREDRPVRTVWFELVELPH